VARRKQFFITDQSAIWGMKLCLRAASQPKLNPSVIQTEWKKVGQKLNFFSIFLGKI
jgi:hypothetical protein